MAGSKLQAHARSLLWQAWTESAEEIASAAVEVLAGRGMLVEEGGAGELEKLRTQVRFLVGQVRRKDAASGEGDRAVAEFLAGGGESQPEPERLTVEQALVRLRQYMDRPVPTWSTASYGNSAAEGTLARIGRTLADEAERLRAESAADHRTWRHDLGKLREAQDEITRLRAPRCICGHTAEQHFEDACVTEVTGCTCGDYLEPSDAADVIDQWRQAANRLRAEAAASRAAVLDEVSDRLAKRATLYGDSRTVNQVINDVDELAAEARAPQTGGEQ